MPGKVIDGGVCFIITDKEKTRREEVEGVGVMKNEELRLRKRPLTLALDRICHHGSFLTFGTGSGEKNTNLTFIQKNECHSYPWSPLRSSCLL
jgi:hypothetical protein